MKAILSFAEAKLNIVKLSFDLGQSPDVIEELFAEGYHLEWSAKFNHYYWI